MKKINNLSVWALKEKLYVAFMMFVNNAIGDFEIVRQWFAFFVNKFVATYAHLDEVFLRYDIDACTKAVQEADAARDMAFRKMRDAIKWFINFPETEAKTLAAEALMRVIELYGGARIPNLGLTAKTAVLANLVDDFEEKYPDSVEQLGIGTLVQELKAAQAVFDEKYMLRAKCESEIEKGAMVEARKQMDEAYRLFVDAVNLKAYEDPDGQLDEFINLMNVEVGNYRTHTGQGQVGGSSGSSTEDETTPAMKTATFRFANGTELKLQFEVGAPIEAPANTEGYEWKPAVPETMPARSKTFREVAIDPEKATATFHFFDHHEEEIRELVGAILHAPENTEGYVWDPAVPETMPAEDTTYFEVPAVQLPPKYIVTYIKGQYTWMTQEYAAGERIVPPAEPEAFRWVDVPEFMPDHDITIYAQYVG